MRQAFNFYRSYWEVANELNDKDRLAFYDALLTRQFTGEETDLKGLVKFAYLSQKHSIDKQIKGYEDKTKRPLLDPSQDPSQGGAQGPSVQEKEKGEVEYTNKAAPFMFRSSLLNYGFKENLVDDWLKVRKAKKVTNTKVAFDGFIKQVEQSKQDKNIILQLCVEKSWAGFNSDWYKPTNTFNLPPEIID
jgi:hypothetical protein